MAQKDSTALKNLPKLLLQWSVLIVLILIIFGILPFGKQIDPETFFPLGGLESVAIWLAGGSVPVAANILQITLGLVILASVILFGKLFCGYLCPLGTLQQLIGRIRDGLHIRQINIRNGSIADLILRICKYGLLFWIFYSSIIAGQQAYNRIDPYFAAISGFESSPVLWMSIASLSLFVVGGFLVDSFWCRYICPLGAIAGTLKFWIWIAGVTAIYFVLAVVGVNVQWWMLLGAFCVVGYLLEVLHRRPSEQLLYIVKDGKMCNHCGLCTEACPYHVDVEAIDDGKVNCVDCTLCGECIYVCKRDLLNVGFGAGGGYRWLNIFPALVTVAIVIFGFWAATHVEIPSSDEKWGIAETRSARLRSRWATKRHIDKTEISGIWALEEAEGLKEFSAKVHGIAGVYGIRTFSGSHRAILSYDPKAVSPEEIARQIYIPVRIKMASPDPAAVDSIKVITARIDGMGDYAATRRLAEKLHSLNGEIYCVETEFSQPLTLHVYASAKADISHAWLRGKAGGIGYSITGFDAADAVLCTKDYLWKMFPAYSAVLEESAAYYLAWKQYNYEIATPLLDNPEMPKIVSALWEKISSERGMIGINLTLNADLKPALQVRYAWPLNAAKMQEILTSEAAALKKVFPSADVLEIPGTESRFYPY